MLDAVFWSAVFGWVLVAVILLAMPSVDEGAAKGWSVFYYVLESSSMPGIFKDIIAIGIVVSNFLCALAGMTSLSRMIYAFARDGGVPRDLPGWLKQVNPTHRTPGPAILVGSVLVFILGMVAGNDANAYIILSSGCAVFLYVSYIMPIGAGLLARGKSWTKKGPFDLGVWSKPVGVLAIIGGAILAFVGFQPPYGLVGKFLAKPHRGAGGGVVRLRAPPLPGSATGRGCREGPPGRNRGHGTGTAGLIIPGLKRKQGGPPANGGPPAVP